MVMVPISVIVPCYRCKDTVERAVESVGRQTLRPREVILVDDASRDGTAEVLELIRDRHRGWIKTIFLPQNCGPAIARNAGWEIASQPYVAFLDADDTWHPRKIEVQYHLMQADPNITISGHDWQISTGVEDVSDAGINAGYRPISFRELLMFNRFSTPTVMLKRDVPLRFEQGYYAEDYLLWLRLVASGYKAMFIDAPLAYRHKAPWGASGLSARLWEMEKGELNAYKSLAREGLLSPVGYTIASSFSVLKFMRRLGRSLLERIAKW